MVGMMGKGTVQDEEVKKKQEQEEGAKKEA